MKKALVIAAFEVLQARRILAVSLGIGFFPFLVPPFARDSFDRIELWCISALWVAAATALGVAVLLGASTIGRDLGEGRAGFWFSRPVGALSLWLGKAGSACAIALGAGLLVLVPVAVKAGPVELLGYLVSGLDVHVEVYGLSWIGFVGVVSGALLVTTLLLLFLTGLAHGVGLVIRARSAWIALDVIGAATVTTISRAGVAILEGGGSTEPLFLWGGISSGAILATLWGAGATQVAVGRADLRRGHRIFSGVFWGSGAATATAFLGFSVWVATAAPGDLDVVNAAWAAPEGSWIYLRGADSGRARDFTHQFLLDPESGRWAHIHGLPRLSDARGHGFPLFSGDGDHAIWVTGGDAGKGVELHWLDLTADPLRPVPLSLGAVDMMEISISGNGTWIAVFEWNKVSVFEMPSGRLHRASSLPATVAYRNAFPGPVLSDGTVLVHSRVHYYDEPCWEPLDTWELPAEGGPFRKIEEVHPPVPTCWTGGERSWDRSRILVPERPDRSRILLLDASSGTLLAALPFTAWDDRVGEYDFLPDGRILLGFREGGRVGIRVNDPEGRELRALDLGPGNRACWEGPPRDGELWVSVGRGGEGLSCEVPSPERTLHRLVIDTGELRPMGRGLSARLDGYRPGWGPPRLLCGSWDPSKLIGGTIVECRSLYWYDSGAQTCRRIAGKPRPDTLPALPCEEVAREPGSAD